MTRQIVVKLNKRKFEPLLHELMNYGGARHSMNYTQVAAKSIWFMHMFMFHKKEHLGDKTLAECCSDQLSQSVIESITYGTSEYHMFLNGTSGRPLVQ